MYLKEIKASGFKSFADNTKIELNNGITGVVGPNGSGKSNIVDAVRWVLGEQSVKSLRGSDNMTNVIFSGSSNRNPANIATITLIFDNKDKYLPLDYNEVSIKRVLYKDSTNEYYINNQKSRLKDITNLFLDTGISKESLNIISQGKIEDIISSKADDRRVVIEEAAGVLKYKKRKEEALRKLEKTHDNILRVNDILDEVKRQVEPLKTQRDKAVKYITLKDELSNIEVALITKEITTLNERYQELKKDIEVCNEEVTKISTKSRSDEAKVEEFQSKILEAEKEISTLNNLLVKLTKEKEETNSRKKIILERQKYEVDDAKYHDNLVSLKESKYKYINEINNLETKEESLESDVNECVLKIKNIESEILELSKKRSNLEKELKTTSFNEMRMKNLVKSLKESIEENQSLPNAVKNIINNPKLTGVHGTIGQLVEVERDYAKAISTALSYASNFLVVDNENIAKESINYLKSNKLGQASFFPLNIIKPRSVDSNILNEIRNEEGFVDVASNLVTYDPKYENIIKNQLATVVISKDIDSANKISRKTNNRVKVVTLDGDVVHVGGSITGGSKKKERNIIADKYELELTLYKLKDADIEVKKLEEDINEIDYNIKSLEDSMYLKTKEKVSAEQKYLEFHNLINQYNDKLDSVEKEIEGINNILNKTLSDEEEEVLKLFYDKEKEYNECVTNLENLENKKSKVKDELDLYNLSLKKENSNYIEISKKLKASEIELNRVDVKLDTLLNNLSETYSMTYDYACKNYHLDMEITEARKRVSSLKTQIKDLGDVNVNAKEEFEKVSERKDFLENQIEDLNNAENTLIEIINKMDNVMKKEFEKTFNVVNENFQSVFKELFKGGNAYLELTDKSNMLETGINIVASPPGKKLSSISLLSGGEKTLTAISLLFAILKSRPVPFCILDEVEAALDEVNVSSFGEFLTKFKKDTQFILITHKKKTMEFADTLYGITMQESGVSKLVSVKLEEMKKDI